MPFHSLSDDSGGTAEDRRAEAWRILEILREFKALGKLTEIERAFVNKTAQGFPVSPKQIFWLREIKDRVID